MTGSEARTLDSEKLTAELADLRRRLFTLRSQSVTEKVEDNSQFRKVRRDIARLLTIQRERSAGGRPTAAATAEPGRRPARKPAGAGKGAGAGKVAKVAKAAKAAKPARAAAKPRKKTATK
jgi:large subunit ribosomal protein L29